MDRKDAEEYTEALGKNVESGWRLAALGERLGVPEALGLTTREWITDRLGGYIKMTVTQRREAIAELTEEGMPQRVVADVLGVSKGTVSRDAAPNGAKETEPTAIPAEPEPPAAPNGAGECGPSEPWTVTHVERTCPTCKGTGMVPVNDPKEFLNA